MMPDNDKLVERLRYGKDVDSWWALAAEAADIIEAIQSEIADYRDEVRRLLELDADARTKHGGLADCTDNAGGPYTSQALANCILRLSALNRSAKQ